MPEKVHTKFGDDTPFSPTDRQENLLVKTKASQVKTTTGTLKRLRDGSPKVAPDPNLIRQGGKENLPELRQVTADSTQDRNANTRGPKKSIDKTETKSQVIEVNIGKPAATNSSPQERQINRKLRPNGPSRKNQDRPNVQSLEKVAKQLEQARRQLPIWSKKADIRWALRNNNVLLVHGETGSGKSTQVPQFLYTEPWCKVQRVKVQTCDGREEEISVGGVIAITQPRRVAAITLAHRVAREVGSPLIKGCSSGKVGYSVRFDTLIPAGTKIKFVTEGMLLQEMLHDPHLRKYSAIIVDEIHERSVDVDLVTGFLRQIIHGNREGRGGVPLKVVIMSATLDLARIEAFFSKPENSLVCQLGSNPRIDSTTTLQYNEAMQALLTDQSGRSPNGSSSWEGFSDSEEFTNNGNLRSQPSDNFIASGRLTGSLPGPSDVNYSGVGIPDARNVDSSGDDANNGVAIEFVRGRQHEVQIIHEMTPSSDYLRSMQQIILQLHVKEPLPGDILAFLTGQEEIEYLQGELEKYAMDFSKSIPRMKIMPLYGALPAQAQQDAFENLRKPFTRKIVLATNIAETSVTVSGVKFVVDCGKAKVRQYRPSLGMESLLAKPISKASAIQRAGRAGREAKGKCFRIYTEQDYHKLEQDDLPEILRCDVIEAVLKMKARGIDNILTFPLMDPPNVVSMERALFQLHMMGTLDDRGNLTEAGKKMATYPLPAAYGRALVAAAESDEDVVLEAIDIISCLTTDSEIFLQPKSDEDQDRIDTNRRAVMDEKGDIITLLRTMQGYTRESVDRAGWCRERLISVRAMKMAVAIRKQLRQICYQQKLLKELPPPDPQALQPHSPILSEQRLVSLLKVFLKAFAMKTALLTGDGSYVTTQGRNPIAIHPSSVLHGKRCEAIMFLEHVFTAKSYAKKVSRIQAKWIEETLENIAFSA